MKKLIAGLLLGIIASGLVLTPVSAAIAEPDSTPTVEEINIYRNVLETADMLLLVYASIPYGSIPDEPVTETFSWSFRSNDGVTEYGATTGYAYNENGYNYNVYSIYLDAAEVAAAGIVWGNPYQLRLLPSPADLPGMSAINYNIVAADYNANVVQSAVQQAIADRVTALGALLDTRWGTAASGTQLIEETESGRVLSIFGESFFRGAIYGLQAMAPNAFVSVITVVDVSARTWTDNYSGAIENQYAGTWVETSQEAGKALFGTSYDLLSVILMLGACIGLIFGNVALTGDAWNGLLDVGVLAVFGARLAFYDFFFLLLITALLWVYIATRIWFRIFR